MRDNDQTVRTILARKLGPLRDKSECMMMPTALFLTRLAGILEEELLRPMEDCAEPFAKGFNAGIRAAAEVVRTVAAESEIP